MKWLMRTGLVLAVILVLGSAVWWVSIRARAPGPIVLKDGTQLSIITIDYGTNFVMFHGPAWQKAFRFLPWSMTSKWKWLQVRNLTTDNPALMVWMDVRHGAGAGPAAGGLRLELAIEDESGHIAAPTSGYHSISVSPTNTLRGFTLLGFPRRQKRFVLHVYDRSNYSKPVQLTELEVANPARSDVIPFAAEPVPVHRTNGNLTLTLTRLIAGVDNSQSPRPAKNSLESHAWAAFQVREDGELTDAWKPVKVWTSDATGNHVPCQSWGTFDYESNQVVRYQPGLWPTEPWKVKAEFSRIRDFDPARVRQFNDIPLYTNTAAGSWARLPELLAFYTNYQAKVGKAIVRVNEFSRRSSTSSEREYDYEIKFQVVPFDDAHRLSLINVTDQNGRPLDRRGQAWGGGDFSFTLVSSNIVSHVNAEVAVHPSRFAEFVAWPEVLPPAPE